MFNNVLSPGLPFASDFLGVNGSVTVRLFFNVPASVSTYSITETGTVADIFGASVPFTETQTVTTTGKLVGDVNGDGVVNCADLAIVKTRAVREEPTKQKPRSCRAQELTRSRAQENERQKKVDVAGQ